MGKLAKRRQLAANSIADAQPLGVPSLIVIWQTIRRARFCHPALSSQISETHKTRLRMKSSLADGDTAPAGDAPEDLVRCPPHPPTTVIILEAVARPYQSVWPSVPWAQQ